MSNNKQTAVEWFFWKLYILKEVECDSIMQLYNQAKEMEDEEFEEETWTHWCEWCQQMSVFSESNLYGTCQCS